jgi:hypothetical protein
MEELEIRALLAIVSPTPLGVLALPSPMAVVSAQTTTGNGTQTTPVLTQQGTTNGTPTTLNTTNQNLNGTGTTNLNNQNTTGTTPTAVTSTNGTTLANQLINPALVNSSPAVLAALTAFSPTGMGPGTVTPNPFPFNPVSPTGATTTSTGTAALTPGANQSQAFAATPQDAATAYFLSLYPANSSGLAQALLTRRGIADLSFNVPQFRLFMPQLLSGGGNEEQMERQATQPRRSPAQQQMQQMLERVVPLLRADASPPAPGDEEQVPAPAPVPAEGYFPGLQSEEAPISGEAVADVASRTHTLLRDIQVNQSEQAVWTMEEEAFLAACVLAPAYLPPPSLKAAEAGEPSLVLQEGWDDEEQ